MAASPAGLLSLESDGSGVTRWTFMPRPPPKATMCGTLRANHAAATGADPDKFWWFITDDSVAAIAAELRERGFCIVDRLMGARTCAQLLDGCKLCQSRGLLEMAQLGGTRGKEAATYSHAAARNDVMGWFHQGEASALEPGSHSAEHIWSAGTLEKLTQRVDTLVGELKPHLPDDLGRIGSRAPLQVACYPGGGARCTLTMACTSNSRSLALAPMPSSHSLLFVSSARAAHVMCVRRRATL